LSTSDSATLNNLNASAKHLVKNNKLNSTKLNGVGVSKNQLFIVVLT
jgi:hypothetical protein